MLVDVSGENAHPKKHERRYEVDTIDQKDQLGIQEHRNEGS